VNRAPINLPADSKNLLAAFPNGARISFPPPAFERDIEDAEVEVARCNRSRGTNQKRVEVAKPWSG